MSVKLPVDEKELLINLKANEETAFEELYRMYSLKIFSKLLRLVKKEEIAEELLQDVFMRVWEKRKTLDPDKSFNAYLYRIAQNLVTDLFRRSVYDRRLLDHLIQGATELYNPIDEQDNAAANKFIIKQALETLPVQRRKVYTLCKLEGKSYQEVSLLLGISISTISDHIVKATKQLKQHLRPEDAALVIFIFSTYLL